MSMQACTQTLRESLRALRSKLGIVTKLKVNKGDVRIRFVSPQENLLAYTHLQMSCLYYRVSVICVGKANLQRGLGRLLHLEAAALAIEEGIGWRLPAYAYTEEGHIAFFRYPNDAVRLLEDKVPVAIEQTQPIADLPWEDPPARLCESRSLFPYR